MSVRLIFHSIWENPGNRGHRFSRLGRALGWQLEKRLTGRARTIRLPNGARFIAHPDCVVSSALIYADWPEFKELQFIRSQLRPADAIIDVGANIGHICLLLSDLVDPQNIFAFEPTPVSFLRLVQNWEANRWRTNNLFQKAVGRSSGIARIPDTPSPETKNAIPAANSPDATVEVPLVSLDDCRSCWAGKQIGFLKIDVEGYETEVFAGATTLLRADRPRLIMFESLSNARDEEISRMLDSAGYSIFQLNRQGRPDFARASAQNLFAVPNEETSAFQ